MSAFDLGLVDGAFITLGIQSLIYMIVGHFRRQSSQAAQEKSLDPLFGDGAQSVASLLAQSRIRGARHPRAALYLWHPCAGLSTARMEGHQTATENRVTRAQP